MKKFNLLALSLALTIVIGSGCVTAQKTDIDRAHRAIDEHRYKFALNRLREAERLADPTPAVKAEIDYLKGVCYAAIGEPVEANAMFHYVAEHFAETEYGYEAKARLNGEGKK